MSNFKCISKLYILSTKTILRALRFFDLLKLFSTRISSCNRTKSDTTTHWVKITTPCTLTTPKNIGVLRRYPLLNKKNLGKFGKNKSGPYE